MKSILISFILLLIIISPCLSDSHQPDELLADSQASDFMKKLFIDIDIPMAYDCLLPKFQNEFSLKEFDNSFGKMARSAKIVDVKAVSYQIIDEFEDIAIYLTASNKTVTGKFRIIMRGDNGGYKVISITTVANSIEINRKPYKLLKYNQKQTNKSD